MLEQSERLMRLLRGERIFTPPLWEVFFLKFEMCKKFYGDYENIDNRIALAKDLGMASIPLRGVNTNVLYAPALEASDGTHHYAGGSSTYIEDFSKRALPDWTNDIKRLKIEQRKTTEAGLASVIGLPWCFHTTATSMGLENFSMKLHDDFDSVNWVFEEIEKRNRLVIEKVISEVRPDYVLFDGDCAYKTGLMVNPDIFRKLVFEKTKKTVSCLKGLDIPYTFHSDGNIDEVIPLLIELGFSSVHGCEKAANDLDHLVEKFGDDIVLVGNMDVVFLTHSTIKQITEETLKMLETGSRKGRYIAACNTGVMEYIPDENYLAMIDAIKTFRR